jgi:hypothetical protein
LKNGGVFLLHDFPRTVSRAQLRKIENVIYHSYKTQAGVTISRRFSSIALSEVHFVNFHEITDDGLSAPEFYFAIRTIIDPSSLIEEAKLEGFECISLSQEDLVPFGGSRDNLIYRFRFEGRVDS